MYFERLKIGKGKIAHVRQGRDLPRSLFDWPSAAVSAGKLSCGIKCLISPFLNIPKNNSFAVSSQDDFSVIYLDFSLSRQWLINLHFPQRSLNLSRSCLLLQLIASFPSPFLSFSHIEGAIV